MGEGRATLPLPPCAAAEEAFQSGCDNQSIGIDPAPLPPPFLPGPPPRSPSPPRGAQERQPQPRAAANGPAPRGRLAPAPFQPSDWPERSCSALRSPRGLRRHSVCGSDARRMRALHTLPPLGSGGPMGGMRRGRAPAARPGRHSGCAGLPGGLARGMRSAISWGAGRGWYWRMFLWLGGPGAPAHAGPRAGPTASPAGTGCSGCPPASLAKACGGVCRESRGRRTQPPARSLGLVAREAAARPCALARSSPSLYGPAPPVPGEGEKAPPWGEPRAGGRAPGLQCGRIVLEAPNDPLCWKTTVD